MTFLQNSSLSKMNEISCLEEDITQLQDKLSNLQVVSFHFHKEKEEKKLRDFPMSDTRKVMTEMSVLRKEIFCWQWQHKEFNES